MKARCPVEDRLEMEDLLVAYAHAVDSRTDVNDVCAVFTPDAEFDLSGIGFPSLAGHEQIAGFFRDNFAAVDAQAHYLTNFAITHYAGNTASIRTYVTGMARYKDGGSITVHGRYHFDVVRTDRGWKAARYRMDLLMPLAGAV